MDSSPLPPTPQQHGPQQHGPMLYYQEPISPTPSSGSSVNHQLNGHAYVNGHGYTVAHVGHQMMAQHPSVVLTQQQHQKQKTRHSYSFDRDVRRRPGRKR